MRRKAEVIRACVCGMSRLRKDFAALEYSERRVISVLVVKLGLRHGPAPGLETVVVVEDMGRAGYHMSHACRVLFCVPFPEFLPPRSGTGSLMRAARIISSFRARCNRTPQGSMCTAHSKIHSPIYGS